MTMNVINFKIEPKVSLTLNALSLSGSPELSSKSSSFSSSSSRSSFAPLMLMNLILLMKKVYLCTFAQINKNCRWKKVDEECLSLQKKFQKKVSLITDWRSIVAQVWVVPGQVRPARTLGWEQLETKMITKKNKKPAPILFINHDVCYCHSFYHWPCIGWSILNKKLTKLWGWSRLRAIISWCRWLEDDKSARWRL